MQEKNGSVIFLDKVMLLGVIWWGSGWRHPLKPIIFYQLSNFLTSLGAVFILFLTLSTQLFHLRNKKGTLGWLGQWHLLPPPPLKHSHDNPLFLFNRLCLIWPLGCNPCTSNSLTSHSCYILDHLFLAYSNCIQAHCPFGSLHILLSLPLDILQVCHQYNVSSIM